MSCITLCHCNSLALQLLNPSAHASLSNKHQFNLRPRLLQLTVVVLPPCTGPGPGANFGMARQGALFENCCENHVTTQMYICYTENSQYITEQNCHSSCSCSSRPQPQLPTQPYLKTCASCSSYSPPAAAAAEQSGRTHPYACIAQHPNINQQSTLGQLRPRLRPCCHTLMLLLNSQPRYIMNHHGTPGQLQRCVPLLSHAHATALIGTVFDGKPPSR